MSISNFCFRKICELLLKIIILQVYPPPQDIANHFKSLGQEIPGFLKDISDPGHVPPHIVCCELLAYVAKLEKEVNLLEESKESSKSDEVVV